jgi:putative hydrolase of the HAD superfamily
VTPARRRPPEAGPAPRLRAVLFDAAGTLLRLREPVGATYARMARPFGVDLPAARLGEAFGRILAAAPPNVHPGRTPAEAAACERRWWRERVRETFRATDGSARLSDFETCFDRLWRHYAGPAAWALAPGAEQALSALRRAGRGLAVVSNFDQRLRGLLAELGVAAFFDAVVLPADAGAAKPDPAIFALCLERLGVAPVHAAYVGDEGPAALAAIHAQGLRTVDVRGLATLAEVPGRLAALEEEAP